MKITAKILHIPPYISSSWEQIKAIYVKENNLMISLADEVMIAIPNLSTEILEKIFSFHASYIEQHASEELEQNSEIPLFHTTPSPGYQKNTPSFKELEGSQILHFNFDSIDSFSSAMQHNLAQANMPNLPDEILNKIAAVAKAIAPEDIQNMPEAEPHCNCAHCQIARAIHGQGTQHEKTRKTALTHELPEEIISEEDLVFQQWDINQTGDKLYSLTNRLDSKEKYSVYLGHPVGCTCGKEGCEHILAVLKS